MHNFICQWPKVMNSPKNARIPEVNFDIVKVDVACILPEHTTDSDVLNRHYRVEFSIILLMSNAYYCSFEI